MGLDLKSSLQFQNQKIVLFNNGRKNELSKLQNKTLISHALQSGVRKDKRLIAKTP